jgi:hypothetical protein
MAVVGWGRAARSLLGIALGRFGKGEAVAPVGGVKSRF